MRDNKNADGKIGLLDVIVATAVGSLCLVAILIWGVPGLDPSLWEETAVVSGLRPPRTIFPGFWRLATSWLFSSFGTRGAIGILSVLGPIVAGALAGLFYLIVRYVLSFLIRTERQYLVWSDRIAPFFAALAAVLFGVSDPLWDIARVFSPGLMRLSIFMVIVFMSIRWFSLGGNWRLFILMALMGVLAAETPLGFLLPIVFLLMHFMVWRGILDGDFALPKGLRSRRSMPKWRMFFLFCGGLALAVWANAAVFVSFGGLEANGWNANDVYFRYAGGYWGVLANAATLIGWVLGLGFAVMPFVVAMRVSTMVLRDDRQMPFSLGIIIFFAGIMATMQSGAFPSLRFWAFVKESVIVHSGFLLAVFTICAMVAIAIFGSVFAFECQRTYLGDDEDKPGILLRGVVPALAGLVLLLAIVHLPNPVETEMQRIVDDAVNEIVDECGDAKWIFTDGRLDPAIELSAAAKCKRLCPLNMMSGSSEWELYVRKRNFEVDSADCRAAETGIPTLLRVWAGEKPHGMDEAALQLGFEFWKRERKPMPKASGLVARETGLSDADCAKGVANAQALSKRILAVSPRMGKASPTPALASAFSAVNWRISRFARMRNEDKLADQLDLSNSALKRMLSIIEYERLRTFMQLTPREGLQLALRRADFTEARRYSAAVLHYDEDDPEANFGMGMSALVRNDHKNAELYLKRVLKRRPDEPAVLNNLSIICRKQKRYQEALDYANKAIKLLPNSEEVKQTLADAIKKAP